MSNVIDVLRRIRTTIANAYRFENGAIMCFNQNGEQMPEYQDFDSEECWQRILKDAPADAEISDGGYWRREQ